MLDFARLASHERSCASLEPTASVRIAGVPWKNMAAGPTSIVTVVRANAAGTAASRTVATTTSATPCRAWLIADQGSCTLREMAETRTGVRVELAGEGAANVTTGLPVIDHLVGELAKTAGLRIALEVAPGSAGEEVAAAGRALGVSLAEKLRTNGAFGRGWATLPADEALASAALEISEQPLVVSNADFSSQRVGGLASDVLARFLNELAAGAGLNVHIRVLEGKDPEHVLTAIFKALGAAIGQACRPRHGGGIE